MGNKVQPNLYRLSVNHDWNVKWFGDKNSMRKFLQEDDKIRKFIESKLKNSGVSKLVIERSPRFLNVVIYTSKAGMIIGRGGTGIEDLKKSLQRILSGKIEVRLTVEEVRNPKKDASLVADNVAYQLEKRIPFRRVLKQSIDEVSEVNGVKGIKIAISGRLDGAEMSRSEYLIKGKIPLSTLRADIDYSSKISYTKYGTIGVKVWIYKGEKIPEVSNGKGQGQNNGPQFLKGKSQ
jgi:small subunit ribosomal protein S3